MYEQIHELPASNSFNSADVLAMEQNDVTFKVAGSTLASALKIIGKYADDDDVENIDILMKLLTDAIPNTTQSVTFDASGNVSTITHISGTTTVRTDAFTYTSSSITEVRTLSTGESLTIATNLSTLETTITYSAA